MKISFLSLAILAVAATGTLSAQEVSAQEGGQRPGARFQYAPNVFRMEQPRLPKGYGAPEASSIRSGSVPSSNMLGLDPQVLQRPQPQVAARPAANHVAGQAFIPKAVPQVAFNPAFGSAFPAQPMPAMAAPAAQAMARAAAPAKAPVAARSAGRRHSVSTGVRGKLKTPIHHSTPAMAATYGPGFGYTQGGHLPSQSGGSMSTNTAVSGRFLNNKYNK